MVCKKLIQILLLAIMHAAGHTSFSPGWDTFWKKRLIQSDQTDGEHSFCGRAYARSLFAKQHQCFLLALLTLLTWFQGNIWLGCCIWIAFGAEIGQNNHLSTKWTYKVLDNKDSIRATKGFENKDKRKTTNLGLDKAVTTWLVLPNNI